MSVKILASYSGSNSAEKIATVKQTIADALGICCEDVIILPGVMSLSAVEVPDALVKARAHADAEAAKAAKAAEAEALKAEAKAAKAEAAAEVTEAHPGKGHKS